MFRLRPVLVSALLATALPAQTYQGEPPCFVGRPTVEPALTFAKLGNFLYEAIDLAHSASQTDTHVVISGCARSSASSR